MTNFVQKNKQWIIYLYTFVLLAVNSVRIFNDSIWGDEGFSIRLASRGIDYLIDRTARDVHPPFYYMILKFFYMLFKPSAMVGKFVSFLPIVLVCIIAITYFYKKYGAAVAMIIVGTVTFTGNCVPMIVEIRMYTWALFFVFANLVCINELLDRYDSKKQIWYWSGLCCFSLMAAYTHYYALIIVAIMDAAAFVMLFLKERKTWKKSVISMVCMILGYLPWLVILLDQFKSTSQDYWITDIDLTGYVLYLFGQDRWGILLLIVFIVSVICFYCVENGFAFVKSKKNRDNRLTINWRWKFACDSNEKKLVMICILATFGTILTGIVVSLVFRPLYVDRYIFPAIGLTAVALSITFVRSFKSKIIIFFLLILMALSGSYQLNRVYKEEASYLTEETKKFMADNLKEGDGILTDNSMLGWTVLEYYLPDYDRYYAEQTQIDNLQNERIWLMLEEDETLLEKCENAGFFIEKKGDLGIDNVDFTLYLLTR